MMTRHPYSIEVEKELLAEIMKVSDRSNITMRDICLLSGTEIYETPYMCVYYMPQHKMWVGLDSGEYGADCHKKDVL